MIYKYRSETEKFYWRDTKEFLDKLNKILQWAAGDMPITVKEGLPEMTTTTNCSEVYYYRSIF